MQQGGEITKRDKRDIRDIDFSGIGVGLFTFLYYY